jgi:hypothetical protein
MLIMFLSGHRLSARPLDMATRGGVGVGLEVQETFIGHPRVLREAANRRMPGQLHQHRRGRAVLRSVGQPRVPQLVQGIGPVVVMTGVSLEQLGRAPV